MDTLLERVCPSCGSAVCEVILPLRVEDFAPLNPTYVLDEIKAMGFSQAQTFDIVRCRQCGFVYSRPILNDELLSHVYTKVISVEKATEYRRGRVQIWRQLPVLHLLFALGYEQAGANVAFLDFGCGWGEAMQIMRACGAKCFGVEVEPQRLQLLRQQGFVVEETLEAVRAWGPFDLVYCNQVLEHVPNPDQTLRQIASAVKSGGYGFFAVPDFPERRWGQIRDGFFRGKGLPTKSLNPWEHLNYFSATSLRALLERNGFNNITPVGALTKSILLRRWSDLFWSALNTLSALSFGLLWRRSYDTAVIVQRRTP